MPKFEWLKTVFVFCLLFLITKVIIAQSTIFNTPSTDIVAPESFYVEGDFINHPIDALLFVPLDRQAETHPAGMFYVGGGKKITSLNRMRLTGGQPILFLRNKFLNRK
jgi:hypothetical protein